MKDRKYVRRVLLTVQVDLRTHRAWRLQGTADHTPSAGPANFVSTTSLAVLPSLLESFDKEITKYEKVKEMERLLSLTPKKNIFFMSLFCEYEN